MRPTAPGCLRLWAKLGGVIVGGTAGAILGGALGNAPETYTFGGGDAPWNNEEPSSLNDRAALAYETTKPQVASVPAVARDNLLPLSLIGAALAWMFLSNSRTASHLGARVRERLNRGTEKVRDAFEDAGQRISDIAQDATDSLSRGTERVRDTFGEAGQRVTDSAEDASSRISEELMDARTKVSDALRSSTQPGTKQTATSVGERGSSLATSAEAQASSGSAQEKTELAYGPMPNEGHPQEPTGFAENKDMPPKEAVWVPTPFGRGVQPPG